MKRRFQEDNAGRFVVFMRQLPSPLMEPDGMQRNIVLYLSDNFNDVIWFPRFYVNRNSYMQMLFAITRYHMSPKNGCWPIEQEGMSFCIIGEWLEAHVITPLSCVPFYLRHHAPSAEVCPPERIVRNYDDFVNVTNLNPCTPACNRKIVRVLDFSGRRDFEGGKVRPFALSFAYDRLETDLYEEVVLTTLPGFISQIGGQFGLMLGICIVSILQLAVGTTTTSTSWLSKHRINARSYKGEDVS
ncbi:Na+ channel [Aphelenchoides avenae]|nr:Na+ channel [Aphelenchus avenae]